MGSLETKAKPILIPLLLGEATVLGQERQATLAAWICLKAMICECADLDDVASTQADREHLMRTLTPPGTWKIWIGQVNGRSWRSAFSRHAVTLGEIVNGKPQPPGGSLAKNTQTITFGIGGLFVHIIATTVPEFEFALPYQTLRHLRQIWPYEKGVFWPTGSIFSDGGADYVAGGFERFMKTLKWTAGE
jgi:hypothetical protein